MMMMYIFHRLYSDPKTRPRYNLLFVLSGGGNFNYFGTKALLDEQLDDPGTYCNDILMGSIFADSQSFYFMHDHTHYILYCTIVLISWV